VITGFNTDIEHDGVVYHVQTEDKGLETPFILSLVYAGGAILASKRARYEDLIESGYSDEALSERLTRQHKLICAAIHAGRIEDLKRMSAPAAASNSTTPAAPEPDTQPTLEILRGNEMWEALEAERLVKAEQEAEAHAAEEVGDETIEVLPPPEPEPPEPPTEGFRRQSVMGDFPEASDGLRITLLGKQEFHSGDTPTLKVMVGYRVGIQETPIAKAAVSVKVLGTTFRPQLYSAKTTNDGVAAIAAKIPSFSSGRAAILIKAAFEGNETELRRVILPER
jgi:hypothetical protein